MVAPELKRCGGLAMAVARLDRLTSLLCISSTKLISSAELICKLDAAVGQSVRLVSQLGYSSGHLTTPSYFRQSIEEVLSHVKFHNIKIQIFL